MDEKKQVVLEKERNGFSGVGESLKWYDKCISIDENDADACRIKGVLLFQIE